MSEQTSLPPDYLFENDVASYRYASINTDPLLYPGERPSTSYVTDGTTVSGIAIEAAASGGLEFSTVMDGEKVNLNEYLSAHNAPALEDRIPVLAYGANMSPGALAHKYKKVGRPDALIIPTVYTTLPGYDVVWSAGPGTNGNFIASLYSGPETVDTAVQVGVNFLTREQLLVLHATELAYDLHKVQVLMGDTELPVYFYAGKDEVYIDDGKPVAVESTLAEGRQLEAASTTGMLEKVLGNDELVDAIRAKGAHLPEGKVVHPQAYVDYVKSLRKKPGDETPRGDLKSIVHSTLAEKGMSRLIDATSADVMSWANPSTLPTYGEWLKGSNDGTIYRLPTSELPIDSWPDPAAREQVLHAIVTHFHRHFPTNK